MSLARLALRLAAVEGLRPSTSPASFVGFIVADTLVVTQLKSGAPLTKGAQIVADGITAVTVITQFESGTGGAGAYKIFPPQTVGGPEFEAQVTFAGVWPTLAGAHVYDTRIDPLDDLDPDTQQPIVCVYTDDTEGKAGQARGGPPFFDTIDLCFELSVVVKVPSDADPAVFVVADPETDAELEASLDLLEAQIRFALLFGPSGEIWRLISKRRVHTPHSTPHRSSEEGLRLARRIIKWSVEVHDDCWDPAPVMAPTGNAVLPFPLQFIATKLAASTYGAKIIAGLVAEPTMPVMPIATPLDTVRLNESVKSPTGVAPAAPNIVAEVDNLEN